MRSIVYYISIVLSVLLVADLVFMAVSMVRGGAYSGTAYGLWLFIPVFIPSFILSLIVLLIYAHGVYRMGWVIYKFEYSFLVVVLVSIVFKVFVVVIKGAFGVDVWL